jgi:isoleucyl-tRNA synthetase
VLDCWFESGSMPFAQVHYPFENADWFEHHYPGDFIVEYIGQTRGWFYTLHVLATALFDRPAFQTCVSHGIVLGTDGQKASKSLRNYVDPLEMFDTYGADAVRWFLLSSAILRGADLIVNEQGIRDAANQVLRPLWNAWSFFTLYANAEGYTARVRTDQTGVLDRYVLAKLHDLVASVTRQMDAYDLFGACASVRSFLDALTNWYIRRSRDRFWDGDADAFDTLATTLDVLTRLAAPLLPLVTEEIYQGLTGDGSRARRVLGRAVDPQGAGPAGAAAAELADGGCARRRRAGAVRRHRAGRGEREAVRVDDRPGSHRRLRPPAGTGRPRPPARTGDAARHPGGEDRRLDPR